MRIIRLALAKLTGWDSRSDQERYLLKYRISGLLADVLCLLPIPLPSLLRLFGSDKHMPGWHAYGVTYDALFRKWKYRRVRLLEIGIGGYEQTLGGRSLLAWQAYFPFGRLLAADILPRQALASRRRHIRQLDQSSPADLDALHREEGPFDIIIDDGSHLNAHQIFTFEHLFGALRNGGIYVIEDVQTSFWPGRVGETTWDGARSYDPRFRQTCYGYFLEMAKHINHAEFVDPRDADPRMMRFAQDITRIAFEHNLIIISKGDNRRRSAFAGRGMEELAA